MSGEVEAAAMQVVLPGVVVAIAGVGIAGHATGATGGTVVAIAATSTTWAPWFAFLPHAKNVLVALLHIPWWCL